MEAPLNRRVLVIDDNPGIHEDLHKILGAAASEGLAELDPIELELLEAGGSSGERYLYQLDSALAGEQALAMLIQALASGRPYALAFVDMRMPGWDGLETIERLWEQDPLLPVVLCTAYSDYSWDQLEARVRNTDHLFLLSKPFDVMEIRQAAAAMTQKRHLAETTRAQVESLQRDLNQSRQELLAEKLQSLGLLADRVSSDLGSDLRAILAEAEACGQAGIQALAARALAKVDRLGGEVAHNAQPLSLNAVLNDLRVDLPAWVQWQLELDEGLPPLRVDPPLLQQLLTELVGNAVESIGEAPGSITLATGVKSLDREFLSLTLYPERPSGSYLWLACRDTGSGMDPATLERIFDPFFTTRTGHQGLGLWRVLGILRGLGGTLRVESEPDRGSTFWLYFPLDPLPPLDPKIRETSEAPSP